MVKPYFVHPDPGLRESTGTYALYVGDLTRDNGVLTLLKAWRSGIAGPLKIVGDGPLRDEVVRMATAHDNGRLQYLGARSQSEVVALIKGAAFTVVPSERYEASGRLVIESFACGVPVIASRLGSIGEVVSDESTGLLFRAGSSEDLKGKVGWAWAHPVELAKMGARGRLEFEAHHSAERNYEALRAIYELALTRAAAR